MSRIQSKVTHDTKNQENHSVNEERQSPATNTEINQILELFDKDFKATIIKMLPQQLQILLRQMNKTRNYS